MNSLELEYEKYFNNLKERIDKEYEIAKIAKSKGIDPSSDVEVPLATSLAERSVKLVSTIYPEIESSANDIYRRIIELEDKYGKLGHCVSLKIAEEISAEKFCKFNSRVDAINTGIRIGFAYNTLGIVSSPIEGFTGIDIVKEDGGEYMRVNYSGPIRSAGGTSSAFSLIIIDYIRNIFGYKKYKPTENEIQRNISEIYDYHERVTNLQYLPSEDELMFLLKNIPIEVSGEPTERIEVSNFRNIERINTNFIRGGMCLVLAEGVVQKAQKILKIIKSIKDKGIILSDWDFLEEFVNKYKQKLTKSMDSIPVYMKDSVAGRPILSYPSRSGGFRFRYGKSRTSGFSAVSVHPATMFISNGFLSIGNQLKLEKPIKGCIVTTCDSIEGPIVKLKNGSVKKINNIDYAKDIYEDVDEIIYWGDMLFSFGDIINRGVNLVRSGYVEEWWKLELDEKFKDNNIDEFNVNIEKSVELSEKYSIPLHPKFIFYWNEISKNDVNSILEWIKYASIEDGLVLPLNDEFKKYKRILEIVGVEHEMYPNGIKILEEKSFLLNLGIENFSDIKKICEEKIRKIKDCDDPLVAINKISSFVIKNKSGEFVGARMGRPEKADVRKINRGSNFIFPIKSIETSSADIKIVLDERIDINFLSRKCEKCERNTISRKCEKCGGVTKKIYFCSKCLEKKYNEMCDKHGKCDAVFENKFIVDDYLKDYISKFNKKESLVVNGKYDFLNKQREFEDIAKGIFRSKYGLHVNKDGTVRYDATEIPISHFKLKEINISVDEVEKLGYMKDAYGNKITNENQIIRIMPHDIILPKSFLKNTKSADSHFLSVSKFLDDELKEIYNLNEFYKLKEPRDLLGHLCVCMAPHNCAGVVGRIIGFSDMQGLVASPFMHAAMRRDCDGDEASIMLLMDVLINFSKSFLPSHRGGTQDAPLVLNSRIFPWEVDDQILDFELCNNYPLSLYELSEEQKKYSDVEIDTVGSVIKNKGIVFGNIGFTHNTHNINNGVIHSTYKKIPSMKEKVLSQMNLVEKIRAVDVSDSVEMLIRKHFLRDIRGNFRKFFRQEFRCSSCGLIHRRPPLSGACSVCGGKLLLTVSEGSIKKYMDLSIYLSNRYNVSNYLKQSVELLNFQINNVFENSIQNQNP